MKKLLIAASFALAMPAGALANAAETYCQVMGRYAQDVATARDAGAPIGVPLRILAEVIEEHGQPVEAWRVEANLAVIDHVYQQPHYTPRQEGSVVYGVCMESNLDS